MKDISCVLHNFHVDFLSVSASLVALLVSLVTAQDGGGAGASQRNRAFFNATLRSSVRLPEVTLSLRRHVAFSFRTCSAGSLIQQTGSSAGGDILQLTLTPEGQIQMSWRRAGQSGAVTIATDSLLTNEWFTVDIQFLQGQIHLSVEQGATVLHRELISNSTFRRFLWDMELGAGLTVGLGFTGCIQEGPSVPLSAPDAEGVAVLWGQCPLEDSAFPACGEY